MIDRNDMLELSRRMTPSRSSVSRIAGAYLDEEGYAGGTFNTHFLKLPPGEKRRNLNLARTVLLSRTNEQLREYPVSAELRKPGSIWQLLDGILESSMKNDAFLEILYEVFGERLPSGEGLACFFCFGQYDVPVKGADREWMEGSEEVYTYLLCTVGPLKAEYEPDTPEFGFLYPAFRKRSSDSRYINIYEGIPGKYRELISWMFSR